VAILHAKKFESCRLRVKGFREVLEAHNASTEAKIVVVEYDSNGAKDIGYKAASDALQATPDLVGIFAINDPAALGAYTAIEEAGKVGQVVLVGFDGQPEGKQAIKEGKIYADPIQFPDQMGVRVVQAIVDHYGGRKPEADALMRRLGLEVPLHVPCRRLTMAQQQILEIAKALLHEARIIVMDEPTASLTPLETRQLFAIIDGLRSRGLGIIYISHRLEEIFRIADRIVVLRDGTKVGERKVNTVDRPGLIAMMVGRPLAGGGPRAAIRRGIALLPEDRKTQGLVLAHSLRNNFGLPNMDWLSTCGFLWRRLERTRFSEYATRLRIRVPAAATLAQAHDGDGQFVNALAAGLEAAGGEVVATARGDAAEAERIFASVKEPIVLGSVILGAVLLDRLKQWAWQRRSGLVDKG